MTTPTQQEVKVKYVVDFSALTSAQKAQEKYRATIQNTVVLASELKKQTDILATAYVQQAQATQTQVVALDQLNQGQQQRNTALINELRAIQTNTATQQQNTVTTQQNTKAKQQSTRGLDINTKQWLKNARTLVFWTIGAASVFRLVQKVRREIIESTEILFKNTQEYERLRDATFQLRASFLALLGTEEKWLSFLDTLAKGMEGLAEDFGRAKAASKSLFEFLSVGSEDLKGRMERFFIGTAGIIAATLGRDDLVEIYKDQLAALEPLPTTFDAAAAGLEAYNSTLQEHTETTDEWAEKLKEAEEQQEKLTDAERRHQQFLEKLVDAEQDRIRALIDLLTDFQRKLEDIQRDTDRALSDLALTGSRKRQDIEIDFNRKLEDIESRAQENRARNEEKFRIKLIRIEMRFRERMIRIEEDFSDAIQDAIANRDATAALRAIRRRSRDIGRAKRERDDARKLARLDFDAQIKDQQRALDRMREDARKARERALEDLRRDMERERQDILLNQQREEDDLDRFFERRRQDIEQDYNWQIARAQAFYQQDQSQWQAHLTNKLAALQNTYRQMIAEHNMLLGVLSQPLPTPAIGGTARTSNIINAQEGFEGIVTQPTTFNVAERGIAERVMVQPLAASQTGTFSGNMQHSISGSINAAMEGLEGRLSVAFSQKALEIFNEVLQ